MQNNKEKKRKRNWFFKTADPSVMFSQIYIISRRAAQAIVFARYMIFACKIVVSKKTWNDLGGL